MDQHHYNTFDQLQGVHVPLEHYMTSSDIKHESMSSMAFHHAEDSSSSSFESGGSVVGSSSNSVSSSMSLSDKRRSKMCQICGADAESYHLNYGAAACLSCRAFFRR